MLTGMTNTLTRTLYSCITLSPKPEPHVRTQKMDLEGRLGEGVPLNLLICSSSKLNPFLLFSINLSLSRPLESKWLSLDC